MDKIDREKMDKIEQGIKDLESKIKSGKCKKLTADQKAKLKAIIAPIQTSINDMIMRNEGRGE